MSRVKEEKSFSAAAVVAAFIEEKWGSVPSRRLPCIACTSFGYDGSAIPILVLDPIQRQVQKSRSLLRRFRAEALRIIQMKLSAVSYSYSYLAAK